jgi:hypothetical protein
MCNCTSEVWSNASSRNDDLVIATSPLPDSNFKQPDASETQLRDLAAHTREVYPECCPLKSEGAGNAGRTMRPQPRVQK